MRNEIYNENNFPIGFSMEDTYNINYYSYKHGCVGFYSKIANQYTRNKPIPGRQTLPRPGTDYGVEDVHYWGNR